ncbi:MAG: hypothetical protein P8179_06490 [Candidatus Thiodiazotropha sp.]
MDKLLASRIQGDDEQPNRNILAAIVSGIKVPLNIVILLSMLAIDLLIYFIFKNNGF